MLWYSNDNVCLLLWIGCESAHGPRCVGSLASQALAVTDRYL